MCALHLGAAHYESSSFSHIYIYRVKFAIFVKETSLGGNPFLGLSSWPRPCGDDPRISGFFRDPQGHGTPWASYYSHTTPIRIPKDMGMVWEACMGRRKYNRQVHSNGFHDSV